MSTQSLAVSDQVLRSRPILITQDEVLTTILCA